jgi:hypothetical protein
MTEIPIACTLNQNDLVKRQDELHALQPLVREVHQIPDGFMLRFDGSTENLMAIAQVMAQERLCCPFLQFQLVAEKGMGSLRLEVTGASGTARFLLTMFGLDNEESCGSSCTNFAA